MGRFGFVGPSYPSESVNADCQKTQNWYPEVLEAQGKSALAMYPTPGLSTFCTLPGPSVRGEFVVPGGRAFAASGPNIFEIFSNGTSTNRGAIGTDGLPVSMAASASQLLIASAGAVYVLNLQTNTLSTIPASTFTVPFTGANGPVTLVGYSDGFFIAWVGGSNKFYVSKTLDATDWTTNGSKIISTFPDNIISMAVDHRELCFLGAKQSEFEYNSGNTFPYDTVPGGFMEQGAIATFATVKMDNSVFWIAGNERGQGVAYRSNGYTPARVSNHAIENAWRLYGTISDARAYSYEDNGHTFWMIYFPSVNGGDGATWCYDVSTQMWHERSFLNVANGHMQAHRSQCHMFAFGKHLVGDWNSGKIYQMDISLLDDAGTPIIRLRRAPHIAQEQQWIFHHQLQVEFDAGLGLVVGQGSNPLVMLRWSDDGGHTWSNQYQASAGPMGKFKTRTIWRRLGGSRNRVYELSVSDPIPWMVTDAYLMASPGFIPSERIAKQYQKVT